MKIDRLGSAYGIADLEIRYNIEWILIQWQEKSKILLDRQTGIQERCADSNSVVGTYISSVVENNHIIILTLKADKICLSAKCYSDESGAKLITVLQHLLLDACRFICLIKSATCASVVSSCSRWLPKEFLRLGYWSRYIILLGTALFIGYSLYAMMELSKERKLAELAKGERDIQLVHYSPSWLIEK